MPDLQGLAHFPGIEAITDASMSFTHGISPAVATITMAPQASPIAEGGLLWFVFGNVVVSFPDCKIDDGSLQWDGEGQKWLLQILDRRWKWAWGEISGHYNVRHDDGTIMTGTEKTPQELAALCFEATDEPDYSVGDLPNEARPSVEWDHAVPMEALASLCDGFACRVVLQLNNRVRICKAGIGGNLPSGAIASDEASIDPPERPQKITVVCGPTRYQQDIVLEAVGEDNDENKTILPIDELDYKPAGGWGFPPFFDNVFAAGNETDMELCVGSVFRMYRIPIELDGLQVEGFDGERVADMQHLIVEDEQVVTREENGVTINKPAEVLGVYFRYEDDYANTPADTIYRHGNSDSKNRGFTLDRARGIIIFSQPVWRNTGTTEIVVDAAQLKLRTAVSVRDADTLAFVRWSKEREIGTIETPTRYVMHEELAKTWKNGVEQIPHKHDVEAACSDFLDGIEAEYDTDTPQTRKYNGLVAISLDGAIQHVTWSVGGQGATTTASRNTEQLHRVVPFKHRRALEKLRKEVRDTPGRHFEDRLGRRIKKFLGEIA